ncbi:nectin-2 isoform X2 [Labeo rohita]|uniref:nectin-2 isoform X2 n=1 Tax=Labeo rohita TaxID=84645 RepID=UPI0021E2B4CE|nr:nectin-2 isoform X2 [Labeo rohita]
MVLCWKMASATLLFHLLFFLICFRISAHPVGDMKGEAPVAGYFEVTLASCFASNARPAAEVMWRLGELEKYLRTETNHTVNPNRTVTVVSYLLGVPLKVLNKKKVHCVVKHSTLPEELVLDYTINIHYPPESTLIIPDSQANPKGFTCVVDSNPEPTNYTWTRVNKSTPYYEGNRLPVPNLSPEFNGLYICYAKNKYGSSSGSLYVNVNTESSAVCSVLLGLLICTVVLAGVVGVIFKFRLTWIRVSRSDNEEPQATEEL